MTAAGGRARASESSLERDCKPSPSVLLHRPFEGGAVVESLRLAWDTCQGRPMLAVVYSERGWAPQNDPRLLFLS